MEQNNVNTFGQSGKTKNIAKCGSTKLVCKNPDKLLYVCILSSTKSFKKGMEK